MTPRPLVAASVGTDFHPFDRLVRWIDDWYGQHEHDVDCVVQYGSSLAPRRASGQPFLDYDEFQDVLGRAAVVVTHGGPSTITESRRHGRTPIVLPRSTRHGEHVDDHQERFASWMAAKRLIVLATDQDSLAAALNRALRRPEDFLVTGSQAAPQRSVQRLGRVVDELCDRRQGQRRRRVIASSQARNGRTR